MFSGIVESVGEIVYIETQPSYTLTIRDNVAVTDTKLGDSISVNGVCLTVTKLLNDDFTVGLSNETLGITTLSKLVVGSRVHLERGMQLNGRVGGHLVQGHVDTTITIKSMIKDGDGLRITFHGNVEYVVVKGFICIDGISLTVNTVNYETSEFSVMLVNYTLNKVLLGKLDVGASCNVEYDQLAKYVHTLVKHFKV